ncbi:hypothetical protein AK830_g548 [Neonectria ditissima]|uniref:Uncharacterized protein n=1 Tax=Neonectria ditissima TaxID=78410 RepID=A0A0P7BLC8_9HYPO|nr:hypothetical protein AK830_g548 [Neonectria ditissima]
MKGRRGAEGHRSGWIIWGWILSRNGIHELQPKSGDILRCDGSAGADLSEDLASSNPRGQEEAKRPRGGQEAKRRPRGQEFAQAFEPQRSQGLAVNGDHAPAGEGGVRFGDKAKAAGLDAA